MRYISCYALKLLAYILHAIYSQIFPKWSKHGHRKMTISQKLTILTIIEAFGFAYRDAEALMRDIGDVIDIKETVTFQDINAFKQRLKTEDLQTVAELIATIAVKASGGKKGRVIMVDSTGFQIMDASSYYQDRAQRKADFAKLHVAMDLETKAIMVMTPTDRYVHDLKPFLDYFIERLRQLSEALGVTIEAVSADSAYASNESYTRVKEELKAKPAIKPRKTRGKPKNGYMAIIWRMRNLPWFKHYADMRWILEAMFKVFKKLFNDHVKSKNTDNRGKELAAKTIVWNTLVLVKQATGTRLLAIGI